MDLLTLVKSNSSHIYWFITSLKSQGSQKTTSRKDTESGLGDLVSLKDNL